MKHSILFLLPVLALTAYSAKADQAISSDQLSTYKSAAIVAADGMPLQGCTEDGIEDADSGGINGTDSIIDDAISASLGSPGEQPVLTFYTLIPTPADGPSGPTNRYIVQINSSADGKSAVSITREIQLLSDVNTGTLAAPVMSQQWVTTHTITCN